MTVKEVRARLRLSESAAYRTMRLMEHVQIGGRLLVDSDVLERYVAAHTKQPAAPWSPPVPRLLPPRPPRARPFKPLVDSPSRKPIVPRTKPRVP